MHWQILYRFLPIKRVVANNQRFMGYCPSPIFSKTCTLFLRSFSPVQFLGQFPSPSPFAHLPFVFSIKSPQLSLCKSYLQSKTFLNVRAAPSRDVFCSNAVLITTPSSSMHFVSFFDVLPDAPTTTGMT